MSDIRPRDLTPTAAMTACREHVVGCETCTAAAGLAMRVAHVGIVVAGLLPAADAAARCAYRHMCAQGRALFTAAWMDVATGGES